MLPLLSPVAASLYPASLDGTPLPLNHPPLRSRPPADAASVDWHAVKSDLLDLFSRSQSVWPADYGTYAPFFVRLAWHNSGSYRVADGRGGAEGGRQRFDPERSWQDNTNLDKARNLLAPLKLKHGPALSWGDLFILSGTVAIEAMGGPVLGFCGGRIDDQDGSDSLALGPSPEQRSFHPCPVNGNCTPPLGAVAVGETKSLIYVDPEGHMGVPDPVRSAADVRWTFAGMAMNDTETVALIGGGHAFGKTHGACPAGAGALPRDDPANPWPGLCGSGRAADAFTSGIEGPWTTRPTRWDNEYFHNVLRAGWEKHRGPGGAWQWRLAAGEEPLLAPSAFPEQTSAPTQRVVMMTSDLALAYDPSFRAAAEASRREPEGPRSHTNGYAAHPRDRSRLGVRLEPRGSRQRVCGGLVQAGDAGHGAARALCRAMGATPAAFPVPAAQAAAGAGRLCGGLGSIAQRRGPAPAGCRRGRARVRLRGLVSVHRQPGRLRRRSHPLLPRGQLSCERWRTGGDWQASRRQEGVRCAPLVGRSHHPRGTRCRRASLGSDAVLRRPHRRNRRRGLALASAAVGAVVGRLLQGAPDGPHRQGGARCVGGSKPRGGGDAPAAGRFLPVGGPRYAHRGGRDARRSARGPRRRGAARGGPRLRLRPGRAQGSAREGVAATDVSWPIRRPRLQPVRRPCGDSDASADRRARAARLIPLTPTGRNFCVY